MPESDRYQQYEVLRRADGSLWELGRGAMGITYKAFDTNLRCPVALKVINSTYLQKETARQRFLNEARAAAALRHPNVASVFNLGTDQSNYFYVMEFIDGETVEALVKRKGRLEPVEALEITQQVARALGAAAKRRLVHRDLKPSNLMLVDDEGDSVVKVIDFGLAKSIKESTDDSAALTMGGFVGTPHFASPEQVEEGEVDVRSDIYSLGATLYFMLTGKAPFSGSVGQVMSQHLYKPVAVEPLADVPQCVIALIQSMLEKDRTKRPQTPRALQNAIVGCLEEIRGESMRRISEAREVEPEILTPGAILARHYRLIEEPGEIPQGLHFIAEDLRRARFVRLLVLRPDFASDPQWFGLLKLAVERLRNAPCATLRAVYSLETAGGRGILVEENIVGPSLQDVLRARGILSAPEAVFLASVLAPIGDHATTNRLEYVDFSLLGIHFVARDSGAIQAQPDLLKQPITDFEHLELKVNGIDFSFTPSQATTLTDFGTLAQRGGGTGPRNSYVRSLSLLVYELLGGPRSQVETTGRYRPIAALSQEGNAVLRSGLVDEFSSTTELARRLAGIVDIGKSTVPLRDRSGTQVAETDRINRERTESGAVGAESKEQQHGTKDPAIQTSPPSTSTAAESTRTSVPSVPVLILAAALSFCVGIIAYLIHWQLGPPQEAQNTNIPALSVQTNPPGAEVLLDGKPPQSPNTFTHVPLGTHQLTATLNDYEPVKQDIVVQKGMVSEIHLKLKPIQEIASLSIQTDPSSASILLDGKPPQSPPSTFTHVPFGTHQLTATRDNYEASNQEIQITKGMPSEIHVTLKPKSSPLDGLVAEVNKYGEGTPEQVTALVRLVQFCTTSKTPDPGEHTKELARIIEELRTKAPPINKDEFGIAYKASIKDAAGLNILPAILWLAENERGRESLALFLRAANLGDSYAMMNVGKRYLFKGTAADDVQAFSWLKRAYESAKPNLEAGAYLGFCYLNGRGTKKDVNEGKKITLLLANQNVVFAMEEAGVLLAVEAQQKREKAAVDALEVQARQWLERAAAKGDWTATARLGQFYQEGLGGLTKSDEQAEKLYQEAIKHDNPLSKYWYALFLIQKKPDRRSEAENLMSQAATAGMQSARIWCEQNNAKFDKPIPDDE